MLAGRIVKTRSQAEAKRHRSRTGRNAYRRVG